jgi:hypothetical protein
LPVAGYWLIVNSYWLSVDGYQGAICGSVFAVEFGSPQGAEDKEAKQFRDSAFIFGWKLHSRNKYSGQSHSFALADKIFSPERPDMIAAISGSERIKRFIASGYRCNALVGFAPRWREPVPRVYTWPRHA